MKLQHVVEVACETKKIVSLLYPAQVGLQLRITSVMGSPTARKISISLRESREQ